MALREKDRIISQIELEKNELDTRIMRLNNDLEDKMSIIDKENKSLTAKYES